MSDLPRDPAEGTPEPVEPELDDDGNPVEPDAELDENGDPVEPEIELDEDGEPLDEPEPEPQQTRTKGPRGRPNGEVIREQTREIADLKRQMQELQRRPAAQPSYDPAAAAREEAAIAERRAMMSPAEIAADVERSLTQRFLQVRANDQAQITARIDKQAYDATARTSRIHEQYRQRVEDLHAAEMARGNYVERETLLDVLVGRDAKARAMRAAPGQRRAAAGRVAAQQARPTGARGDAPQARRPAPDSAAADDAIIEAGRRSGRSPWE